MIRCRRPAGRRLVNRIFVSPSRMHRPLEGSSDAFWAVHPSQRRLVGSVSEGEARPGRSRAGPYTKCGSPLQGFSRQDLAPNLVLGLHPDVCLSRKAVYALPDKTADAPSPPGHLPPPFWNLQCALRRPGVEASFVDLVTGLDKDEWRTRVGRHKASTILCSTYP